jgi:hypothetical protein
MLVMQAALDESYRSALGSGSADSLHRTLRGALAANGLLGVLGSGPCAPRTTAAERCVALSCVALRCLALRCVASIPASRQVMGARACHCASASGRAGSLSQERRSVARALQRNAGFCNIEKHVAT